MPMSDEERAEIEQEGHNAAQEGESRADNPYDQGVVVGIIDSLGSTVLGPTRAQEREEAWNDGYDKFKK
jgi:hypothetical protein